MLLIVLSFFASVHAATAKIDFVARTNMPGVAVEGAAEDVKVQYQKSAPQETVVELDVFALKTGMGKRDQHLREKVFAAKTPGSLIRFQLTELTGEEARGKLKIKDVERDISFPVERTAGGFQGKMEISLSEFQLPRPSFMGVKVEEKVAITFRLEE